MEKGKHLGVDDGIEDMLGHPALKPFAAHLLPTPRDALSRVSFRDVNSLMPWHKHVQPHVVVRALNRIIDDEAAGKPVFYPFHSRSPERENTGLFLFRGKPGTPFALICPGGGFRYVGSLHEGFPLAQFLSDHGYNAFALQYRTGGERVACADMAHALTWIFRHARELEVDTRDYSVWGGSAGGRMAADLGSYGPKALGGADLPRPCVVITAYTGRDWITRDDSPTFSVVSEDDPVAPSHIMKERTRMLWEAGIDARIQVYRNVGHGFGTGEGTEAEGWMELALEFWKKHMAPKK